MPASQRRPAHRAGMSTQWSRTSFHNVYARLQRSSKEEENGYPADALDVWAQRALTWSQGKIPKGLEAVARRRRETFHLLYRWLQTESARRCHGFDQSERRGISNSSNLTAGVL